MKYDVGDGEKSVLVYVQPDVTTFYKDGQRPQDQVQQTQGPCWIPLTSAPNERLFIGK
jgi:hypothetical protein